MGGTVRLSFFESIHPIGKFRPWKWTKPDIARAVLYAAITVFVIYVVVMFAPSRFPGQREEIPATRSSSEVFDKVEQYLKATTHRGFSTREEPTSCWENFGGGEFEIHYLNYGSWLTSAWYERVRYYWRVDDETLEVIPERWWEPVNLTIEC